MESKSYLNGKSKKCLQKLYAEANEINEIVQILNKVEKLLQTIINTEKFEDGYLNAKSKVIGNSKQRCMIDRVPKRIEFELNHLRFFIDFTLLAPESDGVNDTKGTMIYGVNRSTCFAKCIFPKRGRAKCKYCERVSRCDGLEDKPLIQFFIDRHGMIQSAGEFEDSWWVEKVDDLPELHFRTMELIWPKALQWTNENILA